MKQKKTLQSIIRIGLISGLFLFIIIYTRSRTAFLSQGVSLKIENIENGQIFTSRILTLEGIAKRAVMLTINNRELFIDEYGNFEDMFILQPGMNTIVIEAYDKFDTYKKLTYTVWYQTETNSKTILEHYARNHNSDSKETNLDIINNESPPKEDLEEPTETQITH